jgi:hypothetical protein
LEEAEELLVVVVEKTTRVLGGDHPDTLKRARYLEELTGRKRALEMSPTSSSSVIQKMPPTSSSLVKSCTSALSLLPCDFAHERSLKSNDSAGVYISNYVGHSSLGASLKGLLFRDDKTTNGRNRFRHQWYDNGC